MKHPPRDFTHFVTHHLSVMILLIGIVYGAIYLIIRLGARPGRTGGRRPKKVGGFKRRQRGPAGRKRHRWIPRG